jgi:hypothetical protein
MRHSAKVYIFFWKCLFSLSPPGWEASHNSFTSLQCIKQADRPQVLQEFNDEVNKQCKIVLQEFNG